MDPICFINDAEACHSYNGNREQLINLTIMSYVACF